MSPKSAGADSQGVVISAIQELRGSDSLNSERKICILECLAKPKNPDPSDSHTEIKVFALVSVSATDFLHAVSCQILKNHVSIYTFDVLYLKPQTALTATEIEDSLLARGLLPFNPHS